MLTLYYYLHGIYLHIHRTQQRIECHSNFHSRFFLFWSQIVYPPTKRDICCTRSKLRANVYPCTTNPNEITNLRNYHNIHPFSADVAGVKRYNQVSTYRTLESMPMVLSHSSHALANTDSQHLMQQGCSSLSTYLCPVNDSSHCQQQK